MPSLPPTAIAPSVRDEPIVFLIGPPAAGKSTLARNLSRSGSDFFWITDLKPLSELFSLNSNGADTKSCFQDSTYWPELTLSPATTNASEHWLVRSTQPAPDGGHEILNPVIWDECLLRALSTCPEDIPLLIEFSRGFDSKYLEWKGITPSEIYAYAVLLAMSVVDPRFSRPVGVIHLNCSLQERLSRNFKRRILGEHYVAESVMTTIYKSCPLELACADTKMTSWDVNSEVSFPLFRLNTDFVDPEKMTLIAKDWIRRELVGDEK